MNYSKYLLSALFLLVLAFTQLRGEETKIDPSSYRRYVESFDYITNDKFQILAHITLSDGTKWKMVIDAEDDDIFCDLEKSAEPGKEMRLDVDLGTKHFRLVGCVDDETCYTYRVSMDKQTIAMKDSFPKFVKEEEITAVPAGWFTKPEFAYLIYLSDNSIWRSDYPSNWKVGDPILVSCTYPDSNLEWNHINLNKPYSYLYENVVYDLRIVRHFTLENPL